MYFLSKVRWKMSYLRRWRGLSAPPDYEFYNLLVCSLKFRSNFVYRFPKEPRKESTIRPERLWLIYKRAQFLIIYTQLRWSCCSYFIEMIFILDFMFKKTQFNIFLINRIIFSYLKIICESLGQNIDEYLYF